MQQGPWICDYCGKPIEEAKNAYIEWLRRIDAKPGEDKAWGMRLIHNINPEGKSPGCHYNDTEVYKAYGAIVSSMSLDRFQGVDGLMLLLQLMYERDLPLNEVIEMVKRIQIDNYEQARPYISGAILEGEIEPNLLEGFYFQYQLKSAIDWGLKQKELE